MSLLGTPIINGVSYAHADIVINLLGQPVIGVTEINYADKQQIEGNFSTGSKPTSVGFGQTDMTASLKMTLEAVMGLIKIAPNNRIQNIPFFDIGINYLPDSNILQRHALRRCRFKGVDLSSATGNTQIEVSLELFVADIDYNP